MKKQTAKLYEVGKYFGSVIYMPWYSFLEQYQNW